MEYTCALCGSRYSEDMVAWRCACGGVLDLGPPRPFTAAQIDGTESGLWRYAAALPRVAPGHRIRIGEMMTPLSTSQCLGPPAKFKLDFLLPTASYKDRGSAVMLSKLRTLGVSHILEDSSGNAGASVAAYAAAAGMQCTVYVPAANSPTKLAQIRAYGAELKPIMGDRMAVAEAALAAAQATFYASHVWHPAFIAGVATMGYEMWEQSGHRAPDAIIAPAGQGSILLGLWWAFMALLQTGSAPRMPRLYGVQSSSFPALAEAWAAGADMPTPTEHGRTIAEGIACRLPLRGAAVLRAVRDSDGAVLTAGEADIQDARTRLARGGYYVEPTGAVAAAGFRTLIERGALDIDGCNVIVLTGSGLKAPAA